jgi:hypothetical protein
MRSDREIFKDYGDAVDPQVYGQMLPPRLDPNPPAFAFDPFPGAPVSASQPPPAWPPPNNPAPSRKDPGPAPQLPPPPSSPPIPKAPPFPPKFPAQTSSAAIASLFASVYVPSLWQSEILMFGVTVQYSSMGSSGAIPLIGIWEEGAEPEEISPGRYSYLRVQDSDLAPNGPQEGDALSAPAGTFNVIRVDTSAVGYSRLTLKEA